MTNELVPSTAQVMPEGHRGSRPVGRAALVVGVLAIVVIASAAVVAWVAGDDSGPDEALFVLPAPVDDWRLSDGAVTEPVPDADASGTDQRFIVDGSLYARTDGDGFGRLRSVARYPASPLSGARWDRVVTPIGDSYQRLDDSMTFAHKQDDGGWRVVSSPADLVDAYAMLANDISQDLVLLAVFEPSGTARSPVTSFDMTSPDGSTFTVETARGSPLFDAASFADRVEAVDVNGASGWLLVDEGEDAATTVVTWAPETGRTISVRSSASRDAVVDAARRLQPVSADDWASSFPELGPS